jgi:hypothetical protein
MILNKVWISLGGLLVTVILRASCLIGHLQLYADFAGWLPYYRQYGSFVESFSDGFNFNVRNLRDVLGKVRSAISEGATRYFPPPRNTIPAPIRS